MGGIGLANQILTDTPEYSAGSLDFRNLPNPCHLISQDFPGAADPRARASRFAEIAEFAYSPAVNGMRLPTKGPLNPGAR